MKLCFRDASGTHTIELDRDSTSIGRSAGQDVVLAEATVSRAHAVILQEADGYTVVDQNSRHGTFLNGRRVERAKVRAGDELQLGSLSGLKLRFEGDKDEAMLGFPSVFTPHEPFATDDLLSSLTDLQLSQEQSRPAAREMMQLNWLLRAARQLNESGAMEDVLRALLRLTLQLTGMDRGFVLLQREDRLGLAQGLDAAGNGLLEDSTLSRSAVERAIRSESKFLVSNTLEDRNASEWPSVVANSIRSIYCIPLRKRTSSTEASELLGVLYLDSQMGMRDLTGIDHQVLDTIAAEASALLHNALLAEAEFAARQAREELAVAARIHKGLMSFALPTLPYAAIQAKSIPCLAIGGDFFDAVALEDCVCVAVADVSGKGIAAAIVAATLQGIMHSQFLAGRSLIEIAEVVNHFLCTRNVGKYATSILLKLYPNGRVEYANCGHIAPVAVLDGRIRRLEESNLVVGLIAGASYQAAECVLQPGERILLATDGITEAEDAAGNQFGDGGLDEVAHLRDIDDILNRVTEFQLPNQAQDDCTLLEIRYLG